MKNIKNNLELLKIKDLINSDRFVLVNCLLDAEKLTGNKINNLDNDNIENIVINEIDKIIINSASKDRKNSRELQYLLELDIWVNDELYRVTNWFTCDNKTNLFEDTEIYEDNKDLAI